MQNDRLFSDYANKQTSMTFAIMQNECMYII